MGADYFLCGFGAVSTRTTAANAHNKTLIMIKKIVSDDIIYFSILSFLFAKMMLKPQQSAVSIRPNNITSIFELSNPCTIGVNTITARNTWPALSKMFAKRSICAEVNSRLPDNKDDIYLSLSIAQQVQGDVNIETRAFGRYQVLLYSPTGSTGGKAC